MPWFQMLFLMIICKKKYIIRGNNIYFRLNSLFKVDFAKSIWFRISVLPENLSLKQTTENHNRTAALEWSVIKCWGGGLKLVLRRQSRPQFLKWHKTFSWLFGSHDNSLTLTNNSQFLAFYLSCSTPLRGLCAVARVKEKYDRRKLKWV